MCQHSHLAETLRWISRAQETKPRSFWWLFSKTACLFSISSIRSLKPFKLQCLFPAPHPSTAVVQEAARGSAATPAVTASRAPGCHPARPAPGGICLGSLNSLEQDSISSQQLHFLNCSLHGKIASWLITLFHQTFIISKTDLLWLPGHDWWCENMFWKPKGEYQLPHNTEKSENKKRCSCHLI